MSRRRLASSSTTIILSLSPSRCQHTPLVCARHHSSAGHVEIRPTIPVDHQISVGVFVHMLQRKKRKRLTLSEAHMSNLVQRVSHVKPKLQQIINIFVRKKCLKELSRTL